jgi:hypothetical protein
MLVTLVAAAPAAAAEQLIFGGMFMVTGAAKACSYFVGSNRNFFYSSIVYGRNAAGLMIFDFYQTLTLSPIGRTSFGKAGTYTLDQIDRWNGYSTWKGDYSSFIISPEDYSAKTRSIVITGRIQKYNGSADCWVDFRAVGTPS